MKNPISISNIRRPLRLILLIAILLIASNLFISSISQFYIVNKEIDKIGKYYRSVGYMSPIDNNYKVKEAHEIFADDSMIAFQNGTRETIGVIDGLYRNKKSDNIFVANTGEDYFDLIFIGEVVNAYKSRSASNIYEGSLLTVNNIEILAGNPDFILSDTMYKAHEEHHIGFMSHSLETGEKNEYINNSLIDELYKLEPGKKYLFRSTYSIEFESGSFARPLYEGGPLYIEVDPSEEIDWNNHEFKIIKEDMDFINENVISHQLVATEDMTGMVQVQDGSKDYYLIDGRWVDDNDNKNKKNVIVIHQNLAENNQLKVGDKLQIKMRDSEEGLALYTERDRKEWKNYHTSDLTTFEIVGIYESNIFTGSSDNDLYIPESTIPKELGRYTKDLDEEVDYIDSFLYSFVLKNPEDELSFIEKYRESINEMGFDLKFVENNIEGFRESSDPIKRSSMISFGLFTVLLILIQGFVVYIYVEGNKLNYAIERALGIPEKVSIKHLTQPLMIFASVASTIGGYIGYSTAVNKSTELLSTIPSSIERTVDTGLGIGYLILFILLSLLPLIGILLLRTMQLKKTSVIDLINNNKKKR